MSDLPYLDHAALLELTVLSPTASQSCTCTKTSLEGWMSLPLSLPLTQLEDLATLVAPGEHEPTFSEYHPAGTRYWSVDAPIAARYFPYNRCVVSRCRLCGRMYLRYQEGGGYFVDQRIRLLNPELIVESGD
ncbi:hypothetical protein [Burkholderia sp. PU8-34]